MSHPCDGFRSELDVEKSAVGRVCYSVFLGATRVHTVDVSWLRAKYDGTAIDPDSACRQAALSSFGKRLASMLGNDDHSAVIESVPVEATGAGSDADGWVWLLLSFDDAEAAADFYLRTSTTEARDGVRQIRLVGHHEIGWRR